MLKTYLKNLTLLSSAIALLVGMPTVSLAMAPKKPATTQPKAAPKATSIWEQLNLKPDQKKKIQAIRTARTLAINKELDAKQKATFDQLRAKNNLSNTFKGINLNPTQIKNINAARKKANDDLIAVLDSKQKAQLSAYLKQQKSGDAAE